MDEVELFCAIIGEAGSTFPVDIEPGKTLGDLKKAIKEENKENPILKNVAAENLKLFLAKKNNAWLTEKDVQKGVSDTSDLKLLCAAGAPLELVGLSENDVKFEPTLEDVESMNTPVHVLVVVPKIDLKRPAEDKSIILKKLETMELKLSAMEPKTLTNDQRPRKKARSLLRDISNEIPFISLNLNINTWTVGGIDLNIYKVEPDFPKWFYIREETLNIAAVFKAQLGVGRHVVCLGTPGVGKSMLVVVYAFFLALIERKRVVLFRKKKAVGYSMLYLDVENNRFWRKDEAAIEDIADLENREFELCLDGFTQEDVNKHFGTLERFRLLATSVQYPTKNDDTPVLRRCLVPFWSLSDLNKIGEYFQWPDQEIKDRYFYSGGNLRDFLSGTEATKEAIDTAVQSIGSESAKLFKTQYGLTSDRQVDRLRMIGIPENDYQDMDKYMFRGYWVCVITSEYALRQLSKIVDLSYYQELCQHANQLGDDGLIDIAFENYVHRLARDGKKIMLRVRTYDRENEIKAHTYEDLDIESNLCRNDAKDAAECDAAMKRFATSSDDYWYPSCRALETIDCVARLNMDELSNVVALIQITKSNSHSIAPKAINKYARFFSNSCVYIALVPDKQTCDAFRLAPVSPATEVPLKVAYFKKFPQPST